MPLSIFPPKFLIIFFTCGYASYSLDYGRIYFLNGYVADNTMGLINCGTYPVEDTVNFTGSNQQIHDWYVDTYAEFDAFFEKEMSLPSPKAQQEDSVRFESLECRLDLVPVLTVSGSFACVLHDTKAILSARGLLEGFDYSVLDRTVVMEQESGDEVVLRYWLKYGDATVIKVEEAEHGWSTLQMESTEGGRMLLAIPNGKEDRAGVMGLVPGSGLGHRRAHKDATCGRQEYSIQGHIPEWRRIPEFLPLSQIGCVLPPSKSKCRPTRLVHITRPNR